MNKARLLKLIMDYENCGLQRASDILRNLMYRNFYCIVNSPATNAVLTFNQGGETYQVYAERIK